MLLPSEYAWIELVIIFSVVVFVADLIGHMISFHNRFMNAFTMKPIIPSLIAASAAVRPLAQKARVVGMLVLAVGFLATPMLMPSAGNAQDARVAKSMAALKEKTAKLGAPKIDGKEAVGGKDAPALYFGSTKMNNNFAVVDEVAKEGGQGMAASLLVKGGDEYIRVATNVPKPDGSGRAIGTVLDGPALESIKTGKAHYGEVPILGTPTSRAGGCYHE